MQNYIFEAEKDPSSCIQELVEHGICIVRKFLSDEVLNELKIGFTKVLDDEIDGCVRKSGHPTNKGGRQAVVDPSKAKSEGIPVFGKIAYSEFFKQVSHAYFDPHECEVGANVLLTHLKPCPVPILPWHFDRLQTLKFWIYLNDTTKNDGAFEFCPGSHWEGRYRVSYHLATGTSVNDLPNDVADFRIQNPVTLEAYAGDLIIFDPDGFHRGGVVGEGGERKVFRSDTYPRGRRQSFDKFFSRGWFLQKPLNIAKLFRSSTSRVLGDKILDKSKNRHQHDITL